MKRPRKPGMYKFTLAKKFGFPLSMGEWVVGIIFKVDDKWCFSGTTGNEKYAHGFFWPLSPFVGNGEFERIQ